MIKRNENGEIISADKLSEITSELKRIEKNLSIAVKKKGELTEEEEQGMIKDAADMKALFGILTPDLQKTAGPLDLMAYLKQVVKMKELGEKLKEIKND